MIRRKNYETYFIDYLEGNLKENLVNEFIEFLQKNPDLKEELDGISQIPVQGEDIFFKGKSILYKTRYDSEEHFDRAAVAFIDNELDQSESKEFSEYLQKNPVGREKFKLFEKTRLTEEPSNTYKHKSLLYKNKESKKFHYWALRFAAAVLFIFAISALLKQSNEILPPDPVFAEAEIEETNIILFPDKKEDKKEKKSDLVELKKVESKEEKPKKSIRETGRGRLDDDKIVEKKRDSTIYAKLEIKESKLDYTIPILVLSQMKENKESVPTEEFPDNNYLYFADRLKGKSGIDNLDINKIKKAGLKFATALSSKKFTYETNDEGNVIALAYDTRLFAFSIPVNKN